MQSRSTSSRGSRSAAAARRSAPPLKTSPSSTSRPRAPIASVMSPAAAISGRAPLRAATTTSIPGAPGVGDAVDLEHRRLRVGEAVLDRRAGRRRASHRAAAAEASPSATLALVGSLLARRRALVFAAADRARPSRSGSWRRRVGGMLVARRAEQHAAAFRVDAICLGQDVALVSPARPHCRRHRGCRAGRRCAQSAPPTVGSLESAPDAAASELLSPSP